MSKIPDCNNLPYGAKDLHLSVHSLHSQTTPSVPTLKTISSYRFLTGFTIKLIATTDKVGVEDFFSETDKHNKTYEAVKKEIAKDPNLAKALQDPNLTPQQKEDMLNQVTNAVMTELGYKAHENKIVSTDEKGRDGKDVKGFYSTQTGNAYINDKNNEDTTDLVKSAGWEATRAMDDQDGVDFDSNREDRANYANNYGSNLADYTDFAMTINGYDGGLAQTNNHVGTDTSTPSVFNQHIRDNNNEFAGLDKNHGDNMPLLESGRNIHRMPVPGSSGAISVGGKPVPGSVGSSKPANLTPSGASRAGAFRKAKRDNGIPVSQQPSKVETIKDRATGKPIKVYTYKNKDGIYIKIRDDRYGHNYGSGNSQNRGPHFNVGEVKKPGKPPKLKDHYDY
jgi:hypothetical protein